MTMARRGLLVLAFLLLPTVVFAQVTARATLDRTQARMGETVALTITIDGLQQASPPDLSSMGSDFTVLGSSTNSSLSIINGRRTLRTEFGVALRPNHPGTLTVPSIEVAGQRTAPLSLQVDNAAAAPSSRQGPVLLEASADTDHAVVGQAIGFSVRLLYSVDLADGSIVDPQMAGLSLRRIGNDTNYQAQRNGSVYRVLERHYVVFAQHPGKLTIPPVNFQGEALDQRGQDPFFAGTSPVSAASDPVEVTVDPVPEEGTHGTWLPASALSLKLDGLPADGKARVGVPLTLNLTLEATGLPFEVLPALSLPALDGADVYPDKASTGTRDDGSKLIGRRAQAFAVVPTRPGTLSIPAITLRWWNTVQRRMETATVPAATLTVAAAAGSSGTTTPAAAPRASAAAPAAGSAPAAPGTAAAVFVSSRRWIIVAAALGVAWLATLAWALWLWRRRSRAPRGQVHATKASAAGDGRKAFLAVAARGDAAQVEQALLAWARQSRPSLRNLGDLAAALVSPAQRDAIARVQQARFAPGALAIDGAGLKRDFEGGLQWLGEARRDDDELPPLYPSGRPGP